MKTKQKSSQNHLLINKNFKKILSNLNLKQKNSNEKKFIRPTEFNVKYQVHNVYQEWFALNDNAIFHLQNPNTNPLYGNLKKVINFITKAKHSVNFKT